MQREFYDRAFLSSVFYALLICAQPGVLFGTIGQLIACACICALLMFVVAYRGDICELATAALRTQTPRFAAPVLTEAAWRFETEFPIPEEPLLVSLFERPPPFFA
jgi:hypothetical protein